ncbi:MAG: cell division protein FtsH [Candidatus Levybacteria bacterium RIFCSPLOWO2_02_FULL_37_10]|nr:MAG: cell division protein FtsH [Candidatus Levybacteria bacterium RIFCSPHIGHO2_01_FULL_37_33]OGH16910.1 MAG: cell division protein FtsH [Candidatus Levybacteria bacterium RIFCSPHIGHO2_02_FULL_37_11]OGH29874.1 MAG: cell division protein FtsH [Candidatus Levybacteria bacterium RIFCSPHIGHO2_12_FULL_37_12]OGH32980.1 MAG: cell division protein FtsH [Candidatus Levybacteria bacterium RIFCSPLOWO2_01_FULL_36_54]OGH43344.1 MAG: cell division protein FtsH [Candidatus Levybacteria bacterium RIFCSPLOWO
MANGKKNSKKQKIFKVKLNTSWKNLFLYGFLAVIAGFLFLSATAPLEQISTVPLSQVISDVKQGKVKEISIVDNKLTVKEKDKTVQAFKEPGANVYQLFKDAGASLEKTKVLVKDETGLNAWVNILSSVLPIILMVAFFYFIFRQARGAQENIFSFGQSKAKLFSKDTPRIRFSDVAGVDEAKQELTEIVDFLKNPGKYKAMGARTPKGVLMVGPSGTGKTLLARATAGEANVPFFSMAGSEFMEMLVGVGASRVRDLFNTAKKAQPAIIFIDEVDAIGRQRGVGIMGGHDEREQTLNQILVEMDGFAPTEQLVVIAATNRPDVLDPALIRPGRFDRRVMLDMPDVVGRKAILSIHARGKPFEKNVNWERVAKRTVGFSGADIENMLNEAAILAARLEKKAIDMSDLEEAATKVKLGPEKKRLQTDEDRKMTAYHEAGHALVSWEMPHMDPVHRISIVSRGLSLGHTMMEPTEHVHETKTRLVEQISVMLGGRAAENLVFSEMTTGAADDIAKATEVARTMVVEFGMSDLGPINLDGERKRYFEQSTVSQEMAAKIDEQVKRITDAAYKRAASILIKLRKKLDLLASELLKKETIESEEFFRLIGPKKMIKSHGFALVPAKA